MNTLIGVLIVLTQIAAGSILWIALAGHIIRGLLLSLGLGVALGTFLSMLSSIALRTTVFESVSWAVPVVLAAVALVVKRASISTNIRELHVQRSELLGLVVTLSVSGPLLVLGWIRTPLSEIRAGASVDMYFFEALSRGIAQFGPTESILMTGGSLRYHWFTYAWAGELSSAAHLDTFVALTRILPITTVVGAILLGVGWAAKLTFGIQRSPIWVPTLAGLLITVGGYTGALYGGIVNLDSPSQALSTVWLLALVIVFTTYVSRQETDYLRGSHLALLLTIALLASATMGGKASSAAVAIAGMLLATAVGIALRSWWWRRAALASAVAISAGLITYVVVLSGVSLSENLADSTSVRASTWQQLDPLIGKWGPLVGTLGLALAVLTRSGGLLWLMSVRDARRQPTFLVALGAVIAGILALFALRGGINDLWFVLAASAPAAVVSAYGAGQAAQWLKEQWVRSPRFSPLAWALSIGVVASFASMVLSLNWSISTDISRDSLFAWPGILWWLSAVVPWVLIPILAAIPVRLNGQSIVTRSGLLSIAAFAAIALTVTSIATRPSVLWTQYRPLATDIGLVSPGALAVFTPSEELAPVTTTTLVESQQSAAEWIVNNSELTDIIGTSAPTSAQIPALTGRAMYIAGENYQRGLGDSTEVGEVTRRSEISRSLLSQNWEPSIREMCRSGVDLWWVEGDSPITVKNDPAIAFGDIAVFRSSTLCETLTN